MITKEQALTANEFHENGCSRTIGPRGGEKVTIHVWRRNGATQTWATRPNAFRVPIKYGLRGYHAIYSTDESYGGNSAEFHVPEECPLNKATTEERAERILKQPTKKAQQQQFLNEIHGILGGRNG